MTPPGCPGFAARTRQRLTLRSMYEVRATTPDGVRYLVDVQPAGMPRRGGPVVDFIVGWIWHFVRHPGKWVVIVRSPRPSGLPSSFLARLGPFDEASAWRVAVHVGRQLEAGTSLVDVVPNADVLPLRIPVPR